MHLKSLEINGFKSFADRTKLLFEPGMVAIVGPNGCGKSNVSDAIRWVLGEQRPTALRCAKMQDVIFSGTDNRKPTGMSEVSITFADCEGLLATEFNEVTITRRVFRTGEGQYFLNKTPCRLRDVHRLFMGTGVGTTSYSVMAQGQIDAILSSKPEDRRAIFEEAAGITKFKADRKEALRKLEQTEANLLRLADVIREVKRQISSLQRQAGKAQKYREIRDVLRGLDLFVTRRRLAAADIRIRELESETIALSAQLAARQVDVANGEHATAAIHEEILRTEHLLGNLTQSAAQADGKLVRAQEVIRVNEQRIAEYKTWAERDTREISATQEQIAALQLQCESLKVRQTELLAQADAARKTQQAAQEQFDANKKAVDEARDALQRLRAESVDRERRAADIQNQISSMESRQREVMIRRERLSAEHAQLARAMEQVTQTHQEVQGQLDLRSQDAATCEERLRTLENDRATATTELRAIQEAISRLQAQVAAKRAQLDVLSDRDELAGEFLEGSRNLLDPSNPLRLSAGSVLGPLAEKLSVPTELRLAVEGVLRPWIDAVVIRDAATTRTLADLLLSAGKKSAARMVSADGATEATAAAQEGLTPLLSLIQVAPDFQAAASRLLGHVLLADSTAAVPRDLSPNSIVVTRQGVVFHPNGCVELWMPDRAVSSPLARQMLIVDGKGQLAAMEQDLTAHRRRYEETNARVASLTTSIAEARRIFDESSRQAAQKEGELQTVSRDATRAKQRLEVVARELELLSSSTRDDDTKKSAWAAELQELLTTRTQLVETIATQSDELRTIEGRFEACHGDLTEARIQASGIVQQCEHTAAQVTAVTVRLDELNRTLTGRNQGVQSYDDGIRRLTAENESISNSLESMRGEAAAFHSQIEETRRMRAAKARELEAAEASLSEVRQTLENIRTRKATADVELAECRMRRQNQLDRIHADYALTPEQLIAEADPSWPNGQAPTIEEADARITQLAADLQAIGPVNLVAIEEYKELEERHAFLRAQEADLVKSKGQVHDLIRMINKKTSEMFQATFDQANANFGQMFSKLFNGGTARLVLMENAEDPLECGVDIIARPPGKRPQTISLLSGGERTMTAVSLLFAIYMIKPSPFCMLDELDAALDDSNIGRFVGQLKEFLAHSQFLIITHNHQTIASADIVYGVTMPEKGVSKVVSMRLKDIGTRELAIGADGSVEAPESVQAKTSDAAPAPGIVLAEDEEAPDAETHADEVP